LGEKFVGLQNYVALFHDRIAIDSILNTLLFVFISTFCEILLGLVIALVMHQQFKGRGAVRAAVLVPWAIPTVVASQMWRFLFNDKYGLVNFALFGSDVSHYKAWLADPFFAFFLQMSGRLHPLQHF
jgi:ABC-type sugar transport system permease subunit